MLICAAIALDFSTATPPEIFVTRWTGSDNVGG